jgi:hypothetical protein
VRPVPSARAPRRSSPGRSPARSLRRAQGCRGPAPAGRSFEDGPARSTLLLSGAGAAAWNLVRTGTGGYVIEREDAGTRPGDLRSVDKRLPTAVTVDQNRPSLAADRSCNADHDGQPSFGTHNHRVAPEEETRED